MLCSIFFLCFCLMFELHFLIHLAPLMHHTLAHIFFSLILLDCFVYSWQKGGEYIGEYTGLYRHFYMTHVHTLRGSNSISCTFVGGESYREDAYIKGEKTFFLSCFGLYYSCALVGFFLDAYTSCVLHWSSVGHAFILMLLCFIDCMFGWSSALLYDHCGHFHMTVICLIKLFICFTTCLLDRILLVTLYLSFYHLIYFEGLMCFVQVFQVTGIYVPKSF